MDIYPISFVKNFASIVTVFEQRKARPGSTQVLDFLLAQIKTPIYQRHSFRNGRNGSAKGKILPLKPKSRALNVEKG
jgi:hypothetical protein